MDFIEKLYSNELFAPILFTIVGILTIMFIVVLVLALKDAKNSRKSVVEIAETPDEFNKLNEQVFETPVENAELEKETLEIPKEVVVKEEVVDNLIPENDSFEVVTVDAPEEVVEEPAQIKVENEEVASVELERAESDLDEIAATLLKEYQKETDSEDEERVEAPIISEPQTSPIFVTPDTLPNKVVEEKPKVEDLPNLVDIPVPQPVRVVQTSQIIDSSKKENVSLNEIENEEYNIRR